TVNAAARGTWSKFDLSINSNLGDDLAKGFKQQINAKLEEAKLKLKAFVDGRIKGEKDKLEAQFNKIKSQVTGQIDNKKKELDKARKEAEKQISGEKKQAGGGNKVQDAGKKAVKDLKKKLGF